MSFQDDFLAMMLAHGFNPGSITIDDQNTFHRFDISKKNDRAGYYNLNSNGYGVFGNWKTSEQWKFRDNSIEKLTEQEKAEAHARMREQERKARETKKNEQAQTAARARDIWAAAENAPENHPYLLRKKVKPHIAKVAKNGRLIIPVFDGDEIVSLQFIGDDGEKKFLKGGKKGGCYAVIPGNRSAVYIAEGFATAASVAEATGCETVIAFDAGNLPKVAKAIRKRFSGQIVIAADCDETGLKAAEEAALEFNAIVKSPQSLPEGATDWNDAAVAGQDIAALLALPVALPSKIHASEIIENVAFEVDESGSPKCIKENLALICQAEGIRLRYNVIAKREEILIPGAEYSIDNSEAAAYGHIVSEVKRAGMSTAHIREYITNLCDQTPYNPVAEWITSKSWDGQDRLPAFFDTLQSDNPMKALKMRRWMLSAIAAAFSPRGISAHGVLVLQGKQNMGKTHWFKKLVPHELDLIKDGYILRLDDKDSQFAALSHWLVELGELDATFKKSDIAQMKAFLTADRDIMRLPYAAKKSTFPRRTVFFASVNQKEFLHDETGNRRFWVISCAAINYDHGLDMQQVWAQFYALWLSGESYIMTGEEIVAINEENIDFESIDSVRERIEKYYDWERYDAQYFIERKVHWKTGSEICKEIGIINPNDREAGRAANAVLKLNGNYQRKIGKLSRQVLVPYTMMEVTNI